MAKTKVAVLFGGQSKDYSVSLKSAYSAITALNENNYDVIPIGITRAGRWLYYPGNYESIADGTWENDSDCCPAVISPDAVHHGIIKLIDNSEMALQRVDVIFSVIYGRFGECGRIQGLCKLAGIPFLGSNAEASGAALDKAMTHLLLDEAGVKTVDYFCVERSDMPNIDEIIDTRVSKLHYPLVIKASSCSSSIGSNLAFDNSELKSALKIAFSHHHKAVVENALTGRSFCCCVYENEGLLAVSPVGETVPIESAIDKLNNYISKTSRFVPISDISAEMTDKIQSISKRVFKIMDCQGYAVIDFLLSEEEIYCTKVSTISGFNEESALFTLLKADGLSYSEILEIMLINALESKA